MTTLIESPPTLTPAATSAAPIPARASLSAALESEGWKMVGVRAYRAIAGLTIAVGGGASFLVARLVTDEEITVANVFGFSAVFTAVFAAVAGILAYTAESEHGTIMQTISAQPRRSVVIVAKAAAVAAFGAAIGLAGLGAGAVGAVLGGVEAGDTATMPATIGWATAFTTLSALLGLGIGAIARHGAAAISGLLVWWLVVEQLVVVFVDARYTRFMPFVAGNGMLGIVDETEQVAFDEPKSALVFAAYTLAALAIGTVVVHRTDP